jgi:hypothetical protein
MTFMMRPRVPGPTGTRDRLAGVAHGLAANQTFGGVHGDGADGVLAQVLGDFEHQALAGRDVDGFQGVQDRRQVALELDVDDGADDLHQLAGGGADGRGLFAGRDSLGGGRSLGSGGSLRGGGLGGSGGGSLRSGGLLHGGRLCSGGGSLSGGLGHGVQVFRACSCVRFYVRLLIRRLRRRR